MIQAVSNPRTSTSLRHYWLQWYLQWWLKGMLKKNENTWQCFLLRTTIIHGMTAVEDPVILHHHQQQEVVVAQCLDVNFHLIHHHQVVLDSFIHLVHHLINNTIHHVYHVMEVLFQLHLTSEILSLHILHVNIAIISTFSSIPISSSPQHTIVYCVHPLSRK